MPVSSDDPILSSALAELSAEGALDESAPVTEPTDTDTPDAGVVATPGTDDTATVQPATDTTTPVDQADQTVDPLAGSEPLTYLVDGNAETFEGAYVIPGEGAVIPASALPQLQNALASARINEARAAEYERSISEINRLAEWQTKDEQGQPVTLTGKAALEAQRVTHGRTLATLSTISKVFEQDPTSLLSVDQAGNIVWNRDALEMLSTRAENAAMKTERAIRAKMGALTAPAQASSEPTSETFTATVKQAAQQAGISGLTAEDVAHLTAQLPNYVRTATANDRAQGFQPGQRFVDARFVDVMKYTAQLRAEKQADAVKAAKAAESAGKFNAGQQRGRQAAAASPATPKGNAAAKAPEKPHGREAQWQNTLTDALAEMGIAS